MEGKKKKKFLKIKLNESTKIANIWAKIIIFSPEFFKIHLTTNSKKYKIV